MKKKTWVVSMRFEEGGKLQQLETVGEPCRHALFIISKCCFRMLIGKGSGRELYTVVFECGKASMVSQK